jgi:hypothetical protein
MDWERMPYFFLILPILLGVCAVEKVRATARNN